jgi:phosphonate dehydrogenase
MGAVECAIVKRLRGFGCRLLGVDPHAPMPTGTVSGKLSEAVSKSDYIIVAWPLKAGSRHLIHASVPARARPDALLVNNGRGSVIDEAAVADALTAGTIGGYAADVFEMEEPRSIDQRLLSHPRTLFTPHLGSAVVRVQNAIETRAAENIIDVLANITPRDVINAPRQPANTGIR